MERGRKMWRWLCALLCTGMLVLMSAGDLMGGLAALRVLFRHGGSWWRPMSASERVAWLETALTGAKAESAGALTWETRADGAESAELAVTVAGAEVERLLLLRFSPARYRLEVRVDPHGGKRVDRWLAETNAAAVINGSYYDGLRLPLTPTIAGGRAYGPSEYQATHGAVAARGATVEVVDLSGRDWKDFFKGAQSAFVSYPLLVSGQREISVQAHEDWLANRSFIGVDEAGRFILGTTERGFFSLPRFAKFLRSSPIGLTTALNLDGGPVACQAAQLGEFKRDFCGEWEIATRDGVSRRLRPGVAGARWDLPIVLAVTSRSAEEG